MAETCIVCLGDLRTFISEEPPPDASEPAPDGGKGHKPRSLKDPDLKSFHDDEQTIAHLLPCKHDLHNACLKPWVERANSCPTCRAVFNTVELSHYIGGPVVDSYPVQDKVQEAVLDPGMVVEDELFEVEAWEPCLVCGTMDDGHGSMYCDGCDRAVHVFCAGFDDAPEVWYCENCMVDMENDIGLPGVASAVRRRTRQRDAGPGRQGRLRRNQDATWARVWQEVSRRLDLDLDFPFDEEGNVDVRTDEQRREFRRWQQRFEVANRQGTVNRLRGIAAARLQPERPAQPNPESQEELRAWNAFDKARESLQAPGTNRRRKRGATASPASSSRELDTTAQPQLKRPRLTRPRVAAEQAESSSAAARRAREEPTFLSSLLHEVKNQPLSAGSPAGSDGLNGHYSPRNSSPARSPPSSEAGSPRPVATPPPQRPLSPPLSSAILPISPSFAAATFSPFSPYGADHDTDDTEGERQRGRRRRRRPLVVETQRGDTPVTVEAPPSLPTLSYSAKEEIQRMVKLALGSRYRDNEISKDEYTDINRDVSRRLYDLVKDASALADQAEREKWQQVANDEVKKAVTALKPTSDSGE